MRTPTTRLRTNHSIAFLLLFFLQWKVAINCTQIAKKGKSQGAIKRVCVRRDWSEIINFNSARSYSVLAQGDTRYQFSESAPPNMDNYNKEAAGPLANAADDAEVHRKKSGLRKDELDKGKTTLFATYVHIALVVAAYWYFYAIIVSPTGHAGKTEGRWLNIDTKQKFTFHSKTKTIQNGIY
jgi:hypothetical protein